LKVDTALTTSEYRSPSEEHLEQLAQAHELVYPLEPTGALSWWEDFTQSLSQLLRNLFGIAPEGEHVTNFIYVVAGLILLYAIYKLIRMGSGRSILVSEYPQSGRSPLRQMTLEQRNLPAEMEKARAAQNHRLLLRLMYLHVLQRLDEKKIISYAKDKTNHDYFDELQDHPIKRSFTHLSRLFEYGWYGHYSLKASQRQEAAIMYQNILHGLGK